MALDGSTAGDSAEDEPAAAAARAPERPASAATEPLADDATEPGQADVADLTDFADLGADGEPAASSGDRTPVGQPDPEVRHFLSLFFFCFHFAVESRATILLGHPSDVP